MTKLRSFIYNVGWMFLDRGFRMVLAMGTCILIARSMGPAALGMLGYAQAIVGIAASVGVLGVDGVLTRDLLLNKEKSQDLIEATSFLRLAGGVISVALIFIVSFFEDDPQQKVMLLILSLTLLITPFQTIEAYNVANAQSRINTVAQAIASCLGFLLKLMAVFVFHSIVVFTTVFLLESSLYILLLKRSFFKTTKVKLTITFNSELVVRIFKQSLPLFISALMVATYMRVDQVMISSMLSKEQLGLYSAAAKISEVIYFIPAAVSLAFYAEIISAKQSSQALYVERVQQLHDILVAISLAISCFVSSIATPLIAIMYGGQYASSAAVLSIHVWSTVFVFLGVASGRWLITENLQYYVLNRTILGCIVKIFLNLFCIPRYGIVGAACATVVSQVVASYVGYAFTSKTHPIFIIQSKALFGHFVISLKKAYNAKLSTNSTIRL